MQDTAGWAGMLLLLCITEDCVAGKAAAGDSGPGLCSESTEKPISITQGTEWRLMGEVTLGEERAMLSVSGLEKLCYPHKGS